MEVLIRYANEDDFEKVYLLIREFSAFIGTPEKVITSPSQMREDGNLFKCLIAEHKEEIVGFATYFIAYYSWTGKAIYLDDLYVPKEYQGNGFGYALFDRVIEIAKSEYYKSVRWQVSKWNLHAIQFYKNRGAVIDEVESNCVLEI